MLSFGNKEFRNLQEQVLKNAQDIETLKGREDLQVVIVNELPEVGDPNYIYLVAKDDGESPDVYDEYIWLADEERYEKIGGVSIDLTNYVDLDSEQTITGAKTIQDKPLNFVNSAVENTPKWHIEEDSYGRLAISKTISDVKTTYWVFDGSGIIPYSTRTNSLGFTNRYLRDAYVYNVYVGEKVDFGNDATIIKDSSNRVCIQFGGTSIIKVGLTSYIKANWVPEDNNTHDLGSSSYAWKDVYIAGNISDGVNTVSVSNISTKVTSAYASGTFDANGEDTIDISGGTPEGLFIFNCGNCQAMLHLTATMVQNAELTPIYIPAMYIYNSSPAVGWLKISKSGNTLTLLLGGGLTHVDSGYAWTLTKTNLL